MKWDEIADKGASPPLICGGIFQESEGVFM